MLWWSVIDEPDIQDIAVLAKASALAKSVALIRTRHGTGTCVCVGASQVVTNNHVLSGSLDRAATPADVEGTTVTFSARADFLESRLRGLAPAAARMGTARTAGRADADSPG
jgi:hypothetical protein